MHTIYLLLRRRDRGLQAVLTQRPVVKTLNEILYVFDDAREMHFNRQQIAIGLISLSLIGWRLSTAEAAFAHKPILVFLIKIIPCLRMSPPFSPPHQVHSSVDRREFVHCIWPPRIPLPENNLRRKLRVKEESADSNLGFLRVKLSQCNGLALARTPEHTSTCCRRHSRSSHFYLLDALPSPARVSSFARRSICRRRKVHSAVVQRWGVCTSASDV